MARAPKPRPAAKLINTTVRDFSGGWNVVDSEQNLTSKFAPVFDNMVTHNDRRSSVRYGYKAEANYKKGVVSSGTGQTRVFTATLGSRVVEIAWPGHPFSIGGANEDMQHLTLSGMLDLPLGGIPISDINRTHSLLVVDANTLRIVVRTTATGNASSARGFNWESDTHMLGGLPIDARYFSNFVILATSVGELIAIDASWNATRIWSYSIANGLAGSPVGWSSIDFIAWDVFSGQLLMSDGINKMLYVDFTEAVPVNYKSDPGAGSNVYIDAFDACKSSFRYFTMHSTKADYETSIRVSAKDTSVVYSDTAPDPGDAVDVDIGHMLSSPDVTVRAFAVMKDTILVIMPNSTVMLRYGTLDDAGLHDPNPVDTLTGFGTSAARTVVEVGGDVFMLDYNGVPSAKLSSFNNSVVPSRVSGNIETAMSRHIGRLSKTTLRLHAFALWDSKNTAVHMYLPKYDETDLRILPRDPFYYTSEMAGTNRLVMWMPKHAVDVGDIALISNVTSDVGSIPIASINGTRTIVGILSDDYVLIEVGSVIAEGPSATGGGALIQVRMQNDETIGYFYRYIPSLRMSAWSRFRGMKFRCGCLTIEGTVLMFNDAGDMFRYGSPDAPVYGDWYGKYDHETWVSGHVYTAGERVYDATDGMVYVAMIDTVMFAATFAEARAASPTNTWTLYQGEPIAFTHELPWADFGNRQNTKALRFIHADAQGDGQFYVDLFVDNQYIDGQQGIPVPVRSIQFTGTDGSGFGTLPQPYGSGRRTREQRLWSMPVRYKLLKVRVRGETTQRLDITALSFLYQKGGLVRG